MNNKAIIWAFIGIALAMLLVWLFTYRPIFSGEFSTENADWGGFGDFFWGLGTMLLTALNVYVFYNLTVIFEKSKEERDKAILRLQKDQLENEQMMNLIKELGCLIGASKSSSNFTGEVRPKILFTLNRIQIFHNLFPSVNLKDQLFSLKRRITDIDSDETDAWPEPEYNSKDIWCPTERKNLIILKLSELEAIMWNDLNYKINNN